jgi:hypothetical protein
MINKMVLISAKDKIDSLSVGIGTQNPVTRSGIKYL